ncbi:tripeptidyl peptidase protein [Lasallia pustulata]|uniref:Tripeptidyl peptidase protein n=1 Tax=Lasallia pustulata TaxID=136370 RepID=A0A1W5CV32_9LECA|nr:tripeptidyl peptidase protein [Lasallia pustulata]
MLPIVTPIVLLTLVFALDIALSSPVHPCTPYAVKDSHVVPRKWTRVGPAPADHRINLQIGLKQSQFDELERHLYEVSDPSHHRYGQHLTSAEVDELVKPSDDALELVHDWFLDNGIDRHRLEYNSAKNWIKGNLDAETLIAIDYPTPLIAFTIGGRPPFDPSAPTTTDTNEPYVTWLNYVLAQPDLPQTISTSYGADEQTVPYAYATLACQQFAQLGAGGITLLFASGDSGVGPTRACLSNDGKNTTMFLPSFPASCPYVTTVGATKDFAPEVAALDPANNFASGVGFSNYFPHPAYQDPYVQDYIAGLGRVSVPDGVGRGSGGAGWDECEYADGGGGGWFGE